MKLRKCTICPKSFDKSKVTWTDNVCRSCYNERRRTRYKKPKGRIYRNSDNYRSRHSRQNKEYNERSFRNFLKARLCRVSWKHPKNITLNYVLEILKQQNELCAISGLPMAHIFGSPYSISIDRIDSKFGYVRGNIQLVCKWVNLAKSTYSNKEILEVLERYASSKRGN